MKTEFKSKVFRPLVTFTPRSLAAVLSNSTPTGTSGGELTTWSRQFFVDAPFVRNFVVAGAEVFATVQKEYKSHYPDPVPPKIVTSLSRMYRTFLLELCQNLKSTGDLTSADLYSNLDFVWNFCEIMFLSSHPDFPVLPYLVDWIHLNFDLTSDILPKVVAEGSELGEETTLELWNLIYSHVFHGTTREAARLLSYLGGEAASSTTQRHIALMEELLSKRPEFRPEDAASSLTEFEALFTAWQEECVNRLENGAFSGSPNFTFVCKILCGDDEAFASAVAKGLITWYEYMVLLLNYKYPTIRPAQLKAYAVRTLQQLDLVDKLEARDAILLHAMDLDVVSVLREITAVWDNPWVALHLSDLIFACGRSSISTSAKKQRQGDDANFDFVCVVPLRNDFLLEYGTTLMVHETLWQMGLCYLDALPDGKGRPVIRTCFQRRNPFSEQEAQKLVQIAERYGFGDEIKGICRQICLSKLKRGGSSQAQNALLWAIKAGDEALTTRIVDKILFEGDAEIDVALLDALLANVLDASLAFLHEFSIFRRAVSEGRCRDGVISLCSMIKRGVIPKRLAIKILSKNESIFDDGTNFEGDDVTTLMEYVQRTVVTQRGDDNNAEDEKQVTALNRKLIKIRAYRIMCEFRRKATGADEEEDESNTEFVYGDADDY